VHQPRSGSTWKHDKVIQWLAVFATARPYSDGLDQPIIHSDKFGCQDDRLPIALHSSCHARSQNESIFGWDQQKAFKMLLFGIVAGYVFTLCAR